MSKVNVEADFTASAADVWAKISEFGGLDVWAPGIEKCELEGKGVGAVRRISMGGMEIAERMENLDDANRQLSYSIVEGPMPVENYLATISIFEGADGGARLTWICDFDAPGMSDEQVAGMAAGMEGAYQGMIEGLQKHLG
ncbi:SRPBCC family protein [Myxococcota bacterium]|nr:SRPBCC family protein [Myxococcota bacterium]